MNFAKKNTAFTLIEIVVVIAIMGFLTAIIYSSFDTSKAQSRDQKKISDMGLIQIGLEQFFQKNGYYPVDILDQTFAPKYLSSISTDLFLSTYHYIPLTKTFGSNTCISYQLWTKFELNNQYLNSKKGYDSVDLPTGANNNSKTTFYQCGNNLVAKINADTDALVYDVMP